MDIVLLRIASIHGCTGDTLPHSSVLDDLGFSGTVEFGSNKIYINTSAPKYLKLPNQTASGPLHAGMISCTVEDPDGGGGYNNGTGQNEVASGSLGWNIPSSFDITKLEITSIAYDPSVSVGGDAIRIVVKDDDGDWWKVVVDFKQTHAGTRLIDKITATSKAAPGVKSIYNCVLNVDDPSTYPIDLLSESNYAPPKDACYQYANINDTNTLVTYLDSGSTGKHTALIFYELDIDDV